MELLREICRLKWSEKKSNRAIGRILKISKETVKAHFTRVVGAGISSWEQLEAVDDDELKRMVFPLKFSGSEHLIDFPRINKELRRKNMTMMLLWEEERGKDSGLPGYSHFCGLYRDWKKKQKITMRQVHKAGEKAFVDYAGTTVPITDRKTGELIPSQIFVMALGSSHYTFVEATWTQGTQDFLGSHVRAFEFFGGVPEVLVPDNLKTGVNMASKYEPELNRSYREMCRHYGTVVVPARVRKPQDKSIVENAVLHVSRWILARMRDMTFFSLEELNGKIKELLVEYNDRKMTGLEDSRKELFEELERPALSPLPSTRFEVAAWKKAKANIDYHIELEGCYYSVPYRWRGDELLVRYTDFDVEIFRNNKRIAVHKRLYRKRGVSTVKEHMPSTHRWYADWTPSRIVGWAEKTGPCCTDLCKKIMDSRMHPEHSYRSCLGIIKLGSKYSRERLENACGRALSIGGFSYRSVKSILDKGLDRTPLEKSDDLPDQKHENIRGGEYYQLTINIEQGEENDLATNTGKTGGDENVRNTPCA